MISNRRDAAGRSASRHASASCSRPAPAVAFIAVWAFRWLSMGAIENDHFVALARAHQILHGDWPVRDFTDPGQPLAYLLSAGAALALRRDAADRRGRRGHAAVAGGIADHTSSPRAPPAVCSSRQRPSLSKSPLAPRLYNAGKILIPLAAVGTRLAICGCAVGSAAHRARCLDRPRLPLAT